MSDKDLKEAQIRYLHRKVDAFADLMKNRLESNLHKDPWGNFHVAELFLQATKGMGSLASVLLGEGAGGKMQILSEAADVANHLLMIVDNEWGLTNEDSPMEKKEEDS